MIRQILRVTLYAGLILFVFSFQSVLGRSVSFWNVRPDFIPIVLGCAAVFEPVIPAALIGLFSGMFCDLFSYSGVFYSFFYFFGTAAVSWLSHRYFYPHALICFGAGMILFLISRSLCFFLWYFPIFQAPVILYLRILAVGGGSVAVMFYPLFVVCRRISTVAEKVRDYEK